MVVVELKKEVSQTQQKLAEDRGENRGDFPERRTETLTEERKNRVPDQLHQGIILLQDGQIVNLPASERFRILRAKIERQNLSSKRYYTIAVTSAVPDEGKSVVAVNLARALSIDPMGKTLLIDCDMRKPAVHGFFKISESPGLSDVLVRGLNPESAIYSLTPRLDVLAAGTLLTDPTQAVEQPELVELLASLRERYRYIVIDCPPVLLCPEPITLSSLVDGTLLVVRAWKADKRLVNEAIDIIGRNQIMGLVMNDIIDASRIYDYYGYYGYKSDQIAKKAANG